MTQTKVINLFGGPGCGKSTTAAGLFFNMKAQGINCEIAREYAKDIVWEGRMYLLENQIYIFAKQLKRLKDLEGKVDYIICDSPLLFSILYSLSSSSAYLDFLVLEEFDTFDNYNFLLSRRKEYLPIGRIQTEKQAIKLDKDIKYILDSNLISYTDLNGISQDPVKFILRELGLKPYPGL